MLHALEAIGHSGSLKMKPRRKQVFVAVAAGDSQRRARSDHARSDDVTIINRIAQRDICIIYRPQVSHRCKTCLQRPPRVPRAMQRFARR